MSGEELNPDNIGEMEQGPFDEYVDKLLSLSLEDMRERVAEFTKAKLEARAAGDFNAATIFLVLQTQWQTCYLIHKKLERATVPFFGLGGDRAQN